VKSGSAFGLKAYAGRRGIRGHVCYPDGFSSLKTTRFAWAADADLPKRQAAFMAHAMMSVALAGFDATVDVAAWQSKPSFAIIATEDRALNSTLARWTCQRSGTDTTEVRGSHYSGRDICAQGTNNLGVKAARVRASAVEPAGISTSTARMRLHSEMSYHGGRKVSF
jgi:hypothetical protein